MLAVTPLNWFDAHYGADDTLLPSFAIEPESVFTFFAEWRLPEAQGRAFVKEKVARIAGRRIAAKYGWKVGDRLTLRSPGYNVTLDLALRGIYDSSEEDEFLALHWDYMNDALGHLNMADGFWVLARTAEDVPRLTQQIDTTFRNAALETRTRTMKQFVLSFLAMLGNVKLILLSISAAVVFAVLLIVANAITMSIRERTAELAVLRALGFRTRQVLGLLTAESLAISLAGAAAGGATAWILLRLVRGYRIGGMMPTFVQVDIPTVLLALGIAIGISLASTLLPAYRASRLSISQALRFVG